MSMKHKIIIKVGRTRKKDTLILETDEDVSMDAFRSRRTLNNYNFPHSVKFQSNVNIYDQLPIRSQDIFSIEIDGEDINKDIKELAESYGYTFYAPLLYHLQFSKDDELWNWYPTTGSLNNSNNPIHDVEDVLMYINDENNTSR